METTDLIHSFLLFCVFRVHDRYSHVQLPSTGPGHQFVDAAPRLWQCRVLHLSLHLIHIQCPTVHITTPLLKSNYRHLLHTNDLFYSILTSICFKWEHFLVSASLKQLPSS